MTYIDFKEKPVYDNFIAFRKKIAARRALNNAVKSGIVDKPIHCELCKNKKKLHGHHKDYGQPLKVVWLCQKCHTLVHKFDHPLNPSNNEQTPNWQMMNASSIQVSFNLKNADYQILQQIAFSKGKSITETIRALIREQELSLQLKFDFDLDIHTKVKNRIHEERYHQLELFKF